MAPLVRVAACHASPVYLNALATTQKAISLIKEAASHNANLVVFPEVFIPAFPVWSGVCPPADNHELFQRMVKESIYADGPEISSIRETASQHQVAVSIGFSERSRHSNACLWNSNMIIGSNGEMLVHHRKLVATFFEKLTWSPGDGHGLRVAETDFGRLGTLICGENTNPLARYALMAQAEQIHVSTFPAVWPTRMVGKGMKDKGDEKGSMRATYNVLAANRTRAAAHCFEAKCFGVVCCGQLGEDMIDVCAENASEPERVVETLRSVPKAATFFLSPTGAALPSFVFRDGDSDAEAKEFLQDDEGILYADMDLDDCIEGKQYHDVVGGYQRLDVFDLKVDRTRREPVVFTERDTGRK